MAHKPKANPAFDTGQIATDERRAHVRFPCEGDSSCSPITAGRGQGWSGKIRDISRGGIGILLSRRVELGTLLSIEIQLANNRNAGTQLARVVHVTPHSGGGWVIGCCFTNELSDDEVAALANP
jgi:hypothetical protein